MVPPSGLSLSAKSFLECFEIVPSPAPRLESMLTPRVSRTYSYKGSIHSDLWPMDIEMSKLLHLDQAFWFTPSSKNCIVAAPPEMELT